MIRSRQVYTALKRKELELLWITRCTVASIFLSTAVLHQSNENQLSAVELGVN